MEAQLETPTIAAAVSYARLGWRVVPVRGKVPAGGAGWPSQATSDPGEAICLFEDTPHDGVGVVLGPTSGLIDLDCDSPAAEETLQRLFGGAVPRTPTYQSAKGLHRLFRWSDDLPDTEKAKAKFVVDALEIRIGGGEKAAQTVFPPSGGRQWVISPEDCPVAELPDEVLAALAARVAELRKPAPLATTSYTPAPVTFGEDRLNVPKWLARHNVPVISEDAGKDGAHRWFIRCPGTELHTSKNAVKDCVITQEADGRLGGHCFHSSCGMSDWARLRDAIGPLELIDYREPTPVDEAAIAGILATADAPVTSAAETDDEEDDDPIDDSSGFPERLLSPAGLLGAVIEHTLRTALYPQPEMALAAALALLATVTGRKVTDCFGTRTNVYLLSLGETGTGKEHPRKVNKDLLLRSGAEKMVGSERVGSHAGIVNAVFESNALLMQLDEMGRLLATMKSPEKSPHLYNCITVLMQLYSSSSSLWKADAYADTKKVRTIDQPHLVIYGTSTPDAFWSNLSADNISEGMVGRLMTIEGRGYQVDMQEPQASDPTQIVTALKGWVDYVPGGNLGGEHPQPKLVPHADDAKARFMGHVRAINDRRKQEIKLRAALWSRSAEKAAKLALLHACSRAWSVPASIELADVEYGIAMANWFTRRLLSACRDKISENETEARAKRVLAMLDGPGLTANQLTRKTQWMRGRERTEILRDLSDAGLVEMVTVETKGRAKVVLRRKLSSRKTLTKA